MRDQNIANVMGHLGIDLIVFDFDGVLTDNTVVVDESGRESVRCSRSDGLAFDALRSLGIPVFIISSEVNDVVVMRGKKLKVSVINGIRDKLVALELLVKENEFSLANTIYVGNDINDYAAMVACGCRVCPADAHESIKGIAHHILSSKGGCGVARELVEKILGLDLIKILFE